MTKSHKRRENNGRNRLDKLERIAREIYIISSELSAYNYYKVYTYLCH